MPLPELGTFLEEAPVTLTSNRARKGDPDYKAPLPTPGHGLPKEKKPKKARTGRKTRHAGKGAGGGRFIAGAGEGDGGETAAAVQQALSPADKSGIQASVRAFQKKHGLKVDGIVGKQTALALSGRYTEARSTAPGRMGNRERNLLLQRHQPKGGARSRKRASRPARRAGGGVVVEGDGDHHGAAQIVLLEDQPLFGFNLGWDPTLHPRDFAGKFQKKLKVGKKGKQGQSLIPEYDPKGLKFGKGAGGTTGARIAHHPDGSKWLVKTYGGNQDRVATELLSNAVYRHMGAKAARAGRIMLNNGKQALSYPLLDGKPKPMIFQRKGRDNRSAELGAHFMTDALLANWDVTGLEDDNVLWDSQGQPFRVDQGGTLEFRAQGKKKMFGPVPTEVSTMLLPGKGQAARSMLVTESGLRLQARQLEAQLTPGVIDGLVDNAGFQDKAMRERVRKHLKARVAWMGRFGRGEVGFPALQEEVRLEEMAKGETFDWSPFDHPRDVHGKFVKTLFGLGTASGPKVVNLDSKTYVKRDKDNTFRVVRSGMIIKGFQSAEDAARAALDRSVKAKDVDSVGGTNAYKDFNDYLTQRGVQNVKTAATASAVFFGGKQLHPSQAQQELLAINQRLVSAEAVGKEDKYVARAVPTIKARQAELINKMQSAGIKPPEQPGALKGQISAPDQSLPQPKAAPMPALKPFEDHGLKDGDEIVHTVTGKTYVVMHKKDAVHGSVLDVKNKHTGGDYNNVGYIAHATAKKRLETGDWKKVGPAAVTPEAEKAAVPSGLDEHYVPKKGSVFLASNGAKFKSLGVSTVMGQEKFEAEALEHPNHPKGHKVAWPLESAKQYAASQWKDPDGHQLAPDAPPAAPANPQTAAKTAHGLQTGDKFHNSSGTTYEVTGSTLSQLSAKKAGPGPGAETVTVEHVNVKASLDEGVWKKGAGPAPAAAAAKPSSKKFGKNEKQTNALGIGGGPAPIKELQLEPGDKVQFKKGGYLYTVVGPSPFSASGLTVSDPKGKTKHWQGYSKPQSVIKASQGELLKKDPNHVPPVGTDQTPGVVTPATPVGPKLTHEQLKAKLGTPPPMVTMDKLHDGDVIMTPDGKVGIMKPGEPAYQGYVSAYDVKTGQKFEPPGGKPPVKFSNDPAVKKEAAEHLEKATAGTTVTQAGTGAAATQTVKPAAPAVGPPAVFQGIASYEAATTFIPTTAGLDEATKKGIKGYTGSSKSVYGYAYGEINAALRDSKSVTDLELAKQAAAIKKGFADVKPVSQDLIIGRRTTNPKWLQDAQAGKVIQDNGVISTSYTKGTWSGNIELNVLVRKGSKAINVKSISQHPSENEVLLPPGSLFHVLKREEKGGSTVLYVEML